MLKFEPYSLEKLKSMLPYLRRGKQLCSNLSAGFLFMWSSDGDLHFCVHNDTFVIRQNLGDQVVFSWPIGPDEDGMIDKLLEYVRENHMPLRFYAVNEEVLEKIRNDKRLRPAMWSFDSKWSDYIYSFNEALNFKGKKFNGQRNHINRFRRTYGEPDIRLMTPEDRPKIDAMLLKYKENHPDRNAMERLELKNTRRLLDIYSSFGLYAACLFVGGEIVAFSIGEIVGEMLLIHVEKALVQYEGAYPVMYNGFVKLINANAGREIKLINREDDSGDPGLRNSKQQYHPIRLLDKYLVHVNSPAAKLDSVPVINAGNIVLTPLRETDKSEYLALSTDIENNRWWGYDYREDILITGKPDENYFYNSAMLDMKSGDSINFAIRLSENGKMVGEGILWRFTYDGIAEIGCRIMPEYHGKGYGKAAFAALSDFAENKLGAKCVARCYIPNIASRRMIEGTGFTMVKNDGELYYFERKKQ